MSKAKAKYTGIEGVNMYFLGLACKGEKMHQSKTLNNENICCCVGFDSTQFSEYAPIDQLEDAELWCCSDSGYTRPEDFSSDIPLWDMADGDDVHEHTEEFDEADLWLLAAELEIEENVSSKWETDANLLAETSDIEDHEQELENYNIYANYDYYDNLNWPNFHDDHPDAEPKYICNEEGVITFSREPRTPRIDYSKLKMGDRRQFGSRHGAQKPRYKSWARKNFAKFKKLHQEMMEA